MFFEPTEKYTVQYTAGSCGTLLTWFVNQHQNFPGGKFRVAPEYDIALTSKSLHWYEEHQTWPDIIQNLEVDLEKGKIDKFKTACFKTFPHDLIHDINDDEHRDRIISQLVAAGVSRWIYPVFYKNTKYYYENSRVANRKYQVIAKRWQDPMWIHNKNSGFQSIFETQELHSFSNVEFVRVIEKYEIQPLFVDMAALLGGDDDEYERLVRFLNTGSLTDWHDVLMSSVQFWDMPYA